MAHETKELGLQAATAEALELVLELRELKANISLELEATRDQRQTEAREWRELAAAMRELKNPWACIARMRHCMS